MDTGQAQIIAETAGKYLSLILRRQEFVEETMKLPRMTLSAYLILDNTGQDIMSTDSLMTLIGDPGTPKRKLAMLLGSAKFDHMLEPLVIQLNAMGVEHPERIIRSAADEIL